MIGELWNDKNKTLGIRPVITLKSGIKVITGAGTYDSPYEIDL